MRLLFTLLALISIIGCQAQSSATVYIEDSVHTGPWGYFSAANHFVGMKLDTSGSSVVNFVGGDNAYGQYRCSYSDHWQDNPISYNDQQYAYITQTGTYWVYLAEDGSTVNFDWLEIRVVANSFSGTISPLYGTAPSGWQFGYPPYGTHMVAQNAPPPVSQPAPISIKSWLIPLLVVIIVSAIVIPSTIYLVRRYKAKKRLAGLEVEQQGQQQGQEISMEQMNQAVRV